MNANPKAPFAIVLRSFRARDNRLIQYWAESEPGMEVAEIEAEILSGAIDDADTILRVCPVEGTCVDVTKEVAARIGEQLDRRFDAGEDLLDSESAVEFAERFSDWTRPKLARRHRQSWRDVA